MKFFNIRNSLEEFKYSYGFSEKAKSAVKVVGIAAVNTAIFAGKAASAAIEQEKQRLEKQRNK